MKNFKYLIINIMTLVLMEGCATYWTRVPDGQGIFNYGKDKDIILCDAVYSTNLGSPPQPKYIVLGEEHSWIPGQELSKLAVYVSDDATNWSRVNYSGFGDVDQVHASGITQFKDQIIAIGVKTWNSIPQGNKECISWYSHDGTTWNWSVIDETLPSYNPNDPGGYYFSGLVDVAASSECVVAVGSSSGRAIIYNSIDGQNWQKVYTANPSNSNDFSYIKSIKHVDGYFIAFGADNNSSAEWKSTDGTSWSEEWPTASQLGKYFAYSSLENDGSGWIIGDKIWRRNQDGTFNLYSDQINDNDYRITYITGDGPLGDPLMIMVAHEDRRINSSGSYEQIMTTKVKRWINNNYGFKSEIVYPETSEFNAIGYSIVTINPSKLWPVKMLVGYAQDNFDQYSMTKGAIWIWKKHLLIVRNPSLPRSR